MAVSLKRGDFSQIKFGRAVGSTANLASAIHVSLRGCEVAGAKTLQTRLENRDPPLLSRFCVTATKQFVNDDAMRLASDAKLTKLAGNEAFFFQAEDGIRDEHLSA